MRSSSASSSTSSSSTASSLMPLVASSRSSASACATVRGKPSRIKPFAASEWSIRLAMTDTTTSSGTSSPRSMMCLTRSPEAVPSATASRSISPVDNCGIEKRSTIRVACVPFPAPGGPNRTSLIDHSPYDISVVCPCDRLNDKPTRFRAVAPFDHLHPLSRLKILVVFKEVLDLLDGDLRHVGEPGDVGVAHRQFRHRHGDDLLIASALVIHFEHADRPNIDHCAWRDRPRVGNEDVNRIAIIRKGMRNEAVITGVAHRRIQEAINKQRSGSLIHFILDRLTTYRHLHDDVDVIGRVVPDRNSIEVHFDGTFGCRFLIRSETTAGSGSVDISPSASTSFSAIFRKIRRMILPDRVLGRPGANWMTSGAAIGPISLRTHATSSLRRSPVGSVPVINVT